MTTEITGCVKWFNSRHKYGFITVLTEGEYKNTDIFAHQSNIITKEPCYRFLVVGENVKFEIKKIDDEKHPTQAINITSNNGNTLNCEMTRPARSPSAIQQNGNLEPRGRGGIDARGSSGFDPRSRGGFEGRSRGGFEGHGRGGGGFEGRGRGGFTPRGRGGARVNGSGGRHVGVEKENTTTDTTTTTANTTN